jgi:nucleoside-diphosphate-sugar epimerase
MNRRGDTPHQQANISQLSATGFASFMTIEQGLADYADWLCAAHRNPDLDRA